MFLTCDVNSNIFVELLSMLQKSRRIIFFLFPGVGTQAQFLENVTYSSMYYTYSHLSQENFLLVRRLGCIKIKSVHYVLHLPTRHFLFIMFSQIYVQSEMYLLKQFQHSKLGCPSKSFMVYMLLLHP